MGAFIFGVICGIVGTFSLLLVYGAGQNDREDDKSDGKD